MHFNSSPPMMRKKKEEKNPPALAGSAWRSSRDGAFQHREVRQTINHTDIIGFNQLLGSRLKAANGKAHGSGRGGRGKKSIGLKGQKRGKCISWFNKWALAIRVGRRS